MKNEANELLITVRAKQCARISLMGGIGIFLFFAISRINDVMVLSAFYIFFASLANGIILLILLLHLLSHRHYWREILRTAIIMLTNIPFAIFFIWLSIQIADLNHIRL